MKKVYIKFNIGDLFVETCYANQNDWRIGTITKTKCDVDEWSGSDSYFIGITWADTNLEEMYIQADLESWIKRDNAKHYPVRKDEV